MERSQGLCACVGLWVSEKINEKKENEENGQKHKDFLDRSFLESVARV